MDATLHAYLSYSDAPAALDWLTAIGFETVVRWDGPDGRVVHAEVRLGTATLMVASDDADYDVPPLRGRSTGQGVYLRVDDVETLYRRATGAGGAVVFAPETTEWGGVRARVLDPGGREWSFGTYAPGEQQG
jgi:uncharacterized glyoxalase superfamily protein PhnB